MKVHHVGYAVTCIDTSLAGFEQLGGRLVSRTRDLERQVDIAFVHFEGGLVELVSPTSERSPVHGILKRSGAAPYHLCFEAEDLDVECRRLKGEKWVVLHKPSPAPAIEGRRVAFLFRGDLGLIELVESSRPETVA